MRVSDWTAICGTITIMQDRRGQGRERACACDALPEAVQVMFIIASGSGHLTISASLTNGV